MFLADFHIHSTFSDGRMTISELVDFYGTRGFGSIAITDHLCEEEHWLGKSAQWLNKTLTRETFGEYIETLGSESERAWEQYQMRVIPGFEITKNSIDYDRSSHIVALGVDRWVSADQNIEQILSQIRQYGGLSIAAHPVPTRKTEHQTLHLWDRRHELMDLIDAWEVASGPFLFGEVMESKLPMVANTDLHHPAQITSWKNRLDCEKSVEAILDSIRDQDLDFVFYKEPTRRSWNWLPQSLKALSLTSSGSRAG